MTLWRTITTGLAACILILGTATALWAGDVRQDLAASSALEQVLQRGALRVGFSTFVPWAMKDKDGDFIGFEIDVARQLAQDMGVTPQFVPTKWDGILPALLTGKFDIIIGGMGVLPERNLKANFSIPYEYSGMSIVANKQAAPGLRSLQDCNRPDVVVAVRLGTTAEKAAREHLPKATLRQFSDEAQTIQELLTGRAQALVASAPLPEQTAAKYPAQLYLPLDGPFTREPIGFAVRKGDPDFLNFLDNWIRVKTDQGWLKARYDYWFRTLDWQDRVE
ncbi:MAG: transporter substrate-binding domain-containing protein [Desulfovibrionaceae bacterium]